MRMLEIRTQRCKCRVKGRGLVCTWAESTRGDVHTDGKGQSGWERSLQESVLGEVAVRREGRRRAAADLGLCAEGGWDSDGCRAGRG